MSNLDDLAAARTGPRVERARMTNPARLAGYRRRSGPRSFVLQIIVAGWSSLFAILFLLSALSIIAEPGKPTIVYDAQGEASKIDHGESAKMDALGGGALCMFCVWAIVGVPCGIAAVMTYGRPPHSGA